MKILILSMDLKHRVGFPIFSQMHEALKNYPDKSIQVDFIYRKINRLVGEYFRSTVLSGRETEKLLNVKKANQYDVIFAERLPAYMSENWKKVSALKVTIIEDQHNKVAQVFAKRAINDFGFDAFFVRYKNPTEKFNNNLYKKKVIWLPHSIKPNIFHDHGLEKDIGVSCLGVLHDRVYPIRTRVHNSLKGENFYFRVGRPSERKALKGKVWPTGEEYAKILNRSKISATCTSMYHYPIMKIFEIPACRTALACDNIPEMRELGFEPNNNFIPITKKDNFKELFKKGYLNDNEKLQRITDNGYNLIKEKHTDIIRAKEFIEHLKGLLK